MQNYASITVQKLTYVIFFQTKIRLEKRNDIITMQVFIIPENILAKGQREKNWGKLMRE